MLKDGQDAFGHQLYDYYTLENDVPRTIGIVERYDGYIDDSGGSHYAAIIEKRKGGAGK